MSTDDFDYFDYAAATPMDERVIRAMQPFLSERFYNPSATYAGGRAAAEDLQSARGTIAHWLGARPSEIIFTAGGTEANNLAVHGVMQSYATNNIVVSAIEHDAILHPAARYDMRQAGVTPQGVIDTDDLAAKIDDRTVLVSVMYANNEIGTVQPIRDIAAMIATIRTDRRQNGNSLPLYLHTDACQAANYLDLHAARLGVDMMTLNGGKLYGPKQSGALYIKAGLRLRPLIQGGGQEQGLRSGTENVAACAGLATALHIAQELRHDEVQRLQRLQQDFLGAVVAKLPHVQINGSLKKRLPNNVHLTVQGYDNERLLMQLETHGIVAAAGSACSASSQEPSHVLRALGLSDGAARASLRFSMGRGTTSESVDRAVSALVGIVSAG